MDGLNWPTLPGETPIGDISGLRIKGLSTRSQLNAAEAGNILKATLKYLSTRPSRRVAPFNVRWLLRVHREMFGDVWDWAGKPRLYNLNIGVSHPLIRERLQTLVDDLATWQEFNHDIVVQACRLHHRAVAIHPFINGNGRWSRMLANILLKQNRSGVVEWPEEVIGTESTIRAEYIAAIKQADDGDDHPLLELHRQFLRR